MSTEIHTKIGDDLKVTIFKVDDRDPLKPGDYHIDVELTNKGGSIVVAPCEIAELDTLVTDVERFLGGYSS